MSEIKGADMCEQCTIPEDPRYYDIESETYFTCADCACSTCPHLHCCSGQCTERGNAQNGHNSGD